MPYDTTMDDRGRVTIRKDLRDSLGDRFVQILTPHGILLRPLTGLPPDWDVDALTASGEEAAAAEAGR